MDRLTARRGGCYGRRALLRETDIMVSRLERQLIVREALMAALAQHKQLTAEIARLGCQLNELVRQIGAIESRNSKIETQS